MNRPFVDSHLECEWFVALRIRDSLEGSSSCGSQNDEAVHEPSALSFTVGRVL